MSGACGILGEINSQNEIFFLRTERKNWLSTQNVKIMRTCLAEDKEDFNTLLDIFLENFDHQQKTEFYYLQDILFGLSSHNLFVRKQLEY